MSCFFDSSLGALRRNRFHARMCSGPAAPGGFRGSAPGVPGAPCREPGDGAGSAPAVSRRRRRVPGLRGGVPPRLCRVPGCLRGAHCPGVFRPPGIAGLWPARPVGLPGCLYAPSLRPGRLCRTFWSCGGRGRRILSDPPRACPPRPFGRSGAGHRAGPGRRALSGQPEKETRRSFPGSGFWLSEVSSVGLEPSPAALAPVNSQDGRALGGDPKLPGARQQTEAHLLPLGRSQLWKHNSRSAGRRKGIPPGIDEPHFRLTPPGRKLLSLRAQR